FTVAADVATPEAYWLMGVGALVSLLTLYALARAWVLAFWRTPAKVTENAGAESRAPKPTTTEALMLRDREQALFERLQDAPWAPQQAEQKDIPRLMFGATAGMVVVSIALTVFAGPLYAYATRAGENVAHPERMVEQVLGSNPESDTVPGGGSGDTQPQEGGV